MSHYEILINVCTAAFAGFSSGMFGIAGSVVASPILSLALNYSPMIALATPLPSAIPSALSGTYLYNKKKMIHYKLAGFALIGAVPLSLVGSYSTSFIDGNVLMIAKAVFLLILGLNFLSPNKFSNNSVGVVKESLALTIISGAFAGFIAGILAVGGGIVLVTQFTRINNLKMKEAVASSLLCVGVLSILNSIVHYYLNHIEIYSALIIFICVAPFAYLGAKAAITMKNRTLEILFGALMVLFAIYFIIFRMFL